MIRKSTSRHSHLPPSYADANPTRDRLLMEIAELEAKLDKIEGSPSPDNLAVKQTFKEMIYSRNELLSSLSRQSDERTRFGIDQRLQ